MSAFIEEWRPVPRCPGYEVSDQGRVRSSQRWRGRPTPHLLNPTPDKNGYVSVLLYVDRRVVRFKVHQLVALVFTGPRPEGQQTRHLDGNKVNNAVSNLAYGTQSENMLDRIRHGTDPNASKTHCKRGHEFTPENTYVWREGTRQCRACHALWARQAKAARAEA